MADLSNGQIQRQYFVSTVERCPPPSGGREGEWYKYVIGGGMSEITGVRSGTYESVNQYAEEFAFHINERSLLGFSGYPTLKLTSASNKKVQS